MVFIHAPSGTAIRCHAGNPLFKGLLLSTTLGLMINTAQAARPMLTDDASLVEHCQIESWLAWSRHDRSSTFNLAPACQWQGVEWMAGAAISDAGDDTVYQLAAKTLLTETGLYGASLSVQVGHETTGRQTDDWLVNLAATKGWQDDDWVLHLNVGWLNEKQADATLTAGIALQRRIGDQQWLFSELYRSDDDKPFYQIGYFQELIAERLQADISYGNRIHDQRKNGFLTAGIIVYF